MQDVGQSLKNSVEIYALIESTKTYNEGQNLIAVGKEEEEFSTSRHPYYTVKHSGLKWPQM